MYVILGKTGIDWYDTTGKGVLSRRNIVTMSFFKGVGYLSNVEKVSMTGV